MRFALQLYHKVLRQINNWAPRERVTRRRNLALLVIGLYLSGSIHLNHIVRRWPVRGKLPSLTNRLRRFLDNERLHPWTVYEPVVAALLNAFAGQTLRLILDVTQVGYQHRALVVGLGYRRRTLPLTWQLYAGHSGGSSVRDHIALLQRVYRLTPSNCTVVVLGDSEFRSAELVRWLHQHAWHYVLRQRADTMVRQADGPWRRIDSYPLAPGETHAIGWVWLAKTNPFGRTWLLLHWAVGEERPWLLVSDRDNATWVCKLYGKRMWIEEMFGDTKGHGFNLGATRLRDTERLDRLLLGVCLTYLWLISLGSRVVKNGQRHLLDRRSRRDKSYFRLGWDWLDRCFRLGKPVPIHFIPYP